MEWLTLEAARREFPVGRRVQLVFTEDQATRLKPGDEGVIRAVRRELGEPVVDVAWDSGSSLSIVLSSGDQIVLVPEQELHDEYWQLRRQGHGIIGAQQRLVELHGLPWSAMDSITHPRDGA